MFLKDQVNNNQMMKISIMKKIINIKLLLTILTIILTKSQWNQT